jgi:hypothetical protein
VDLVNAAAAAGSPDSAALADRALLSQASRGDWHEWITEWPIAHGPLFSLVQRRWHYIINARLEEQLFDLEADPWEMANLIGTPGSDSLIARFRDELRRQGVNLRADSTGSTTSPTAAAPRLAASPAPLPGPPR